MGQTVDRPKRTQLWIHFLLYTVVSYVLIDYVLLEHVAGAVGIDVSLAASTVLSLGVAAAIVAGVCHVTLRQAPSLRSVVSLPAPRVGFTSPFRLEGSVATLAASPLAHPRRVAPRSRSLTLA